MERLFQWVATAARRQRRRQLHLLAGARHIAAEWRTTAVRVSDSGVACVGIPAAGSVAWLTTVLRRKPASIHTTAARRTVAARRAAYGRSPSSSHVRSPRFFLS